MDEQRTPVVAAATARVPTAIREPNGRPPSWVIVLSAALVAIGAVGRRNSPNPILAKGGGSSREAPRAAGEAQGGRPATTSAPVSAGGWKDILLRVFRGISEDRILLVAAGVAFYAIIALFPGIAALVSIYGLFANPSSIADHLNTLSGVAPGGAVDVIKDQLTRLAQQKGATLGIGFGVSLVVALWFANSGISGLFDALNAVYEEKDQRSLLKYYATTLAFTAGAIVLVLLSIAILVALPIILQHIPNAGVTAVLLKVVRWPFLFVFIVFSLALVYRYGSSRSGPQWRWIAWSSIFAAAAWLVASALFSWYVASFGSYNKMYGSLGAIFGFMTWMWVSMVVVLIGAKLDAELERGTAPGDAANPPAQRRSEAVNALDPARV
jgi:membrane protein